MDMREILDRKDTYLYNLSLIAEHVFGKGVNDRLFGRTLANIQQKMKGRLRETTVGRIVPVERQTDLSVEEFKERYVRRVTPVIFDAAATGWACCQTWTPELFADRYGDDQTLIFNPKTNEQGKVEYQYTSLGDAIAQIEHSPHVNVRFSPLLHKHPELTADLELDWFYQRVPKYAAHTVYQLFLGGRGASTHIHCASGDNLFIQIYGEKHWSLYHPRFNPILQPVIDRTPYFHSKLDHDEPDLEQFPAFRYIDGYHCVLKPGDVLYVPAFYWHFVKNLSTSIGVGFRWLSPLAMMRTSPTLALLTLLSTNPPIWVASRHKTEFGKVITHRKNKRAELKSQK